MLSKFVVAGLAAATTVVGQGFNVVIEHVRPTDGTCTCPSGNDVFPSMPITGSSDTGSTYTPSSTPVVDIESGSNTSDTEGPISTITPSVHWSCDTTKVENVIPKEPSAASPLYYGSSDPTEEGYFGWLTYHFSTCAVNLDESAYITYEYDSVSGLRVIFSSQTVFDLAVSSWNAEGGLVLIGFISGCGEDHDRCYFKVTALKIDSGKLCITASGSSEDASDLIDRASTEFGWWVPGRTKGAGSSSSSSGVQTISASVSPASSTSSSSYASVTSSSGYNSTTRYNVTTNDNTTISDVFSDNSTDCTPPVDSVYGLPTACVGDYFDEDLSDLMGYTTIENNTLFEEFVDSMAPDEYDDSDSSVKRRASKIGAFFKKTVKKIGNTVVALKQTVQKATSISGSINKSLSFKLPNPSSSDSSAKKLKDSSLKQADSPWGSAILLKSFGDSEKFEEAKGKASYLNVYCVDCGAQGSVKVAGRAAWTPLGMTFTQGQLEMHADIKIGLKLGVDAKIKYSKSFNNEILDFGLPGLSYGVITIGPRVSVGSSVTFNAAAEGKLLAGAEMGVADSMVLLDWVTNSNSKTQGWQPYFKPVFQADGELMVSAELGLPVGLKCGIKISSWDKSVGITDTPSIKATAQVAASIGLTDSGFTGALNSSDGCAGIATSISWRNKIDVDILGLWDKTLFDTNDRVLKQDCIKLGASSSSRMLTRASDNSTSTDNSTVTDFTDKVVGNDTLTYEVSDVSSSGYNQTDGYEYSLLVDPDVMTMVVACSNGNVYLAGVNATGLDYCTELFATYTDLLVQDGAGRYLHYYNNTMALLGVSRLRVTDEDDLPTEAIPVVMVPYSVTDDSSEITKRDGEVDPDGEDYDDYNYYALDPYDNVFYPAVCTYTDGSLPRMFVVSDPDTGITKLMESALVNTVTGGSVNECYVMPLVDAQYDDDDDYSSTDDTEDVYLSYDDD